jgi:hypothetical protein
MIRTRTPRIRAPARLAAALLALAAAWPTGTPAAPPGPGASLPGTPAAPSVSLPGGGGVSWAVLPAGGGGHPVAGARESRVGGPAHAADLTAAWPATHQQAHPVRQTRPRLARVAGERPRGRAPPTGAR